MTGPQGGSWIPLGGAIAELVQQEVPGVSITVVPGAGIANVKAVEAGKADLGFGNANSTADAIAGRKPFDGQARPVGNTGEQITREVLRLYGLSYDDAARVNHVSYTDAVELLKNRQADVFTLITTIPASSVMDLATGRRIRLIGLTEENVRTLNQQNPGYARLVIPKGTYPGQETDILTTGTVTHLVASAKLPEDLVEKITTVILKNRDKLAAVVKDIGRTTPKEMGRDIGLPVHPGAQKAFKALAG